MANITKIAGRSVSGITKVAGRSKYAASKVAGASIYSPVTSGLFDHLYWAGGPAFAAANPTNASAIASWPDEMGAANATLVSSSNPTRQDTGGPNGRTSVLLDSNDNLTMTWSGTSGFSIVAIGKFTAADRSILGNTAGQLYLYYNGSDWVFEGGSLGACGGHVTAIDSNYHLFTGISTTTRYTMEVDGVVQQANQSGGTPRTLGTTYIGTMGPNYYYYQSYLPLLGIKKGSDIRDASGWTTFEDWTETEYGLTVAA